jgi:hypothetical protein
LQTPSVAIDGSKFKAVNNRDRNFTQAKMARRMAQIEESVTRYLSQLDSADRQERSDALKKSFPHSQDLKQTSVGTLLLHEFSHAADSIST